MFMQGRFVDYFRSTCMNATTSFTKKRQHPAICMDAAISIFREVPGGFEPP